MKKAIVMGGAGMIGVHLVHRLRSEGHWVAAFDMRDPPFGWITPPSRFEKLDLANPVAFYRSDFDVDWVFQLAAEMGGAGYIFTGENDLSIMSNSVRINVNTANRKSRGRIFFSSSACVYAPNPWSNEDAWDSLYEDLAYPAEPDSNYGWEKLFSERLYLTSGKDVRVARLHNIFAPYGTYEGGREKAPAALARKVAEQLDGGHIDIWGDGEQQRSFLYVDECIEGILRLMESDFSGPVNIGSDQMVTINRLADMLCDIAGKNLAYHYIAGPQGVRGRNSNNSLIKLKLGWAPSADLRAGLEKLFGWVDEQVKNRVDSPSEAL